jgi:hypothetical protein
MVQVQMDLRLEPIGKRHARAIACENCYVEVRPPAAAKDRCRHRGILAIIRLCPREQTVTGTQDAVYRSSDCRTIPRSFDIWIVSSLLMFGRNSVTAAVALPRR